jgi:hypothetical protein
MGGESLFTTIEAAREIETPVSPDDIARLARKGLIPAVRVGRRWLLTAAAVRQVRTVLGRDITGPRPVDLVLVSDESASLVKGHSRPDRRSR